MSDTNDDKAARIAAAERAVVEAAERAVATAPAATMLLDRSDLARAVDELAAARAAQGGK